MAVGGTTGGGNLLSVSRVDGVEWRAAASMACVVVWAFLLPVVRGRVDGVEG